jgi:hypothetical protein
MDRVSKLYLSSLLRLYTYFPYVELFSKGFFDHIKLNNSLFFGERIVNQGSVRTPLVKPHHAQPKFNRLRTRLGLFGVSGPRATFECPNIPGI